MGTYIGRMWFDPDRDAKLRVEIQLDTESIRITANDNLIGEWPMSEITVRSVSPTKVHLQIEGEEVVLSSRDPDFMPAFARVADAGEAHTGPRLRAVPERSVDGGLASFAADIDESNDPSQRQPRPAAEAR